MKLRVCFIFFFDPLSILKSLCSRGFGNAGLYLIKLLTNPPVFMKPPQNFPVEGIVLEKTHFRERVLNASVITVILTSLPKNTFFDVRNYIFEKNICHSNRSLTF